MLLRRQDVVPLVAAWALLLQGLIGQLLPSHDAMTGQGVVMCTAKGAVATKEAPAPSATRSSN